MDQEWRSKEPKWRAQMGSFKIGEKKAQKRCLSDLGSI